MMSYFVAYACHMWHGSVLSESNFEGMSTPNVDSLLGELDRDGRGFVTREEWRIGCRCVTACLLACLPACS
jgi:hypothetical protein